MSSSFPFPCQNTSIYSSFFFRMVFSAFHGVTAGEADVGGEVKSFRSHQYFTTLSMFFEIFNISTCLFPPSCLYFLKDMEISLLRRLEAPLASLYDVVWLYRRSNMPNQKKRRVMVSWSRPAPRLRQQHVVTWIRRSI
jgi:hypothetical protein